MKDVIVLAAGLGRRLAGATTLPKWLVPVGGACPAQVQLAGLEAGGAERIFVVTSQDQEAIARQVEPWRDRLSLSLVPNPHAATRNNWYSLVIGFEAWMQSAEADEVTVVNSDLYARPAWFAALLGAMAGAGSASLAIDGVRPLTEEAMKVSSAPGGTQISAIGKVGVTEPCGEYVGVSWWARPAAEELLEILRSFEGQPARIDNWYEHGIQEHLRAGGRYRIVPVPDSDWVEIDDERDLELARALGP